MERWQSVHEHRVAYNLSESGVAPMTVGDLLAAGDVEEAALSLEEIALGYAQGNGEELLRRRIAALYPGAGAQNVLITHGGAEANFLTTLTLLEPGDDAVIMMPNYMQIPGLIAPWGGRALFWNLDEERGWDADVESLHALITERTKLILLTNPNNPTGRAFDDDLLDAVADAARRCGAWVIADEIYRGAEVSGPETASFWGRYEKTVITSGLSKAYGLPGLRTGWAASPDRSMIEKLWANHDYSTICSSPLTQALAAEALHPRRRNALLARTRKIIGENLPVIRAWADSRPGRFVYRAPDAGAILWLRCAGDIPSLRLAEELLRHEDTLILPGAHFGIEGHIRLGFGSSRTDLEEGLARVGAGIDRLAAS